MVAISVQSGQGTMNDTFEEIANIDRLVHDPARLAILTLVARFGGEAEIVLIERLTKMSNGNITLHVNKLAGADLVKTEKRHLPGKRQRTIVRLTALGQDALLRHLRQLTDLERRLAEFDPTCVDLPILAAS